MAKRFKADSDVRNKHVAAGIKFPGRMAPAQLLKELERQREGRKDQIIRSDKIEWRVLDNQVVMGVTGKEKEYYGLNNTAWQHASEYVGIPRNCRWWDFGMGNPEKLVSTFNDYFHSAKDYRLVRALKDQSGVPYCRAILSDKYKIIDSYDYMFAVADVLKEAKADIWQCRLTDDLFVGYAVAEGITGQVDTDRTFDPGDGWISRWHGKEGDVLNGAIAFGNSETGDGSCFIRKAILRRICANFCVYHQEVSVVHLGRTKEDEIVLSQEAIGKDNEAIMLKLRDHVKSVFNEEEFFKIVEDSQKAAKDDIPPEQAEAAAEVLKVYLGIPETRANEIKALFRANGDFTRYGLVNAVTEGAHKLGYSADVGYEDECKAAKLFDSSMAVLYRRSHRLATAKGDKEALNVLAEVAEA